MPPLAGKRVPLPGKRCKRLEAGQAPGSGASGWEVGGSGSRPPPACHACSASPAERGNRGSPTREWVVLVSPASPHRDQHSPAPSLAAALRPRVSEPRASTMPINAHQCSLVFRTVGHRPFLFIWRSGAMALPRSGALARGQRLGFPPLHSLPDAQLTHLTNLG